MSASAQKIGLKQKCIISINQYAFNAIMSIAHGYKKFLKTTDKRKNKMDKDKNI